MKHCSVEKESIMEREIERDAFDVVEEYDRWVKEASCKPDRMKFPYPKVGAVLDREKSVRWNEEEVERQRTAYGEEVKRLNKVYNETSKGYENEIKQLLADEYDISVEEAGLIWAKAYEDGHSYGVIEVYNHFIDFAELYKELRNVKKKKTKE